MLIHIRSDKKDVVAFLKELSELLDSPDFDTNRNLLVIQANKDDYEHSTPYTLIDLEYDIDDIADTLRSLSVSEYSETLIDKDDDSPPLLFVFGKIILGKLIYIKLKIKDSQEKYILCISFHYAAQMMDFPYK